MGPEDLPLIAILAGLLVLSASCSGSETAMFRLRHADRVTLAARNPRASALVELLLSKPRELLITILLLNMVVNVVYFAFASVLAMRVEGALAQTLAGILPLIALIIVGEVFAKIIAGSERVRVAAVIARPLLVLQRVVTPARVLVDVLAIIPVTRLVSAPGGSSDEGEGSQTNTKELGELIAHAADAGHIDDDEQRLLAEVIVLGDRRVRELMTPRQQIDWLPEGFTSAELLELVERTGHSKFPVCRGSLDGEILGFVDARTYLSRAALRRARPHDRSPTGPPEFEQPRFASEASRIDQLLDLFRTTGSHVALCVDEHGSIRGVISIRAIVDSLELPGVATGQVTGLEQQVQLVGLGEWLVPGGLSAAACSEVFGVELAAGGPATVAGLVLNELGRMPEVGDTVRVGPVEIEVEAVAGRTIDRARVRVIEPPPDPAGDTDEESGSRA